MMTEREKIVEKWAAVALYFSLVGLCLLSIALRDRTAFMGHVLVPVFGLVAVLGTAYRCHRNGVVRELRELRRWLASEQAKARLEYLTEFRFWRKSFWKPRPPRRKDG
jgi:hypothetical protein